MIGEALGEVHQGAHPCAVEERHFSKVDRDDVACLRDSIEGAIEDLGRCHVQLADEREIRPVVAPCELPLQDDIALHAAIESGWGQPGASSMRK